MIPARLFSKTILLAVFIVALNGFALGTSQPDDADPFDSPRLAALTKELEAGHESAIDKFWQEMAGKAPLIEPTGDDPHASWVTFVWRGDAGTLV